MRNGRSGSDAVARRLDRFFVVEDLLTEARLYRSWVDFPFISDQALIFLQLDFSPLHRAYPFKLNSHWLKERDFTNLVTKLWKDLTFHSERRNQKCLVSKLFVLKSLAK